MNTINEFKLILVEIAKTTKKKYEMKGNLMKWNENVYFYMKLKVYISLVLHATLPYIVYISNALRNTDLYRKRQIHINIHNIHNWPLQPLIQDYGLASHITHAVCVNFIRERQDLQFNVYSERQILEKLFHGHFCLLLEFLL